MPDTRRQRQYGDDARVLAQVGRSLSQAELPPVEVRLPGELDERAVAA